MLWLKRNLFLAIGGAVAVVLLVLGMLYCYSGLQQNSELAGKLEESREKLRRMYEYDPFPSSTNVKALREQVQRVEEAITASKKQFLPIPFQDVRDEQFKVLLDTTLAAMRAKAEQAGLRLPETNYAFTFKAQKTIVKFAPGSWPRLPQMLAEIRALCDILFESRCHLINLRRERLTPDDPPGSTEFTELRSQEAQLAEVVLVPYEVVVSCFSDQLARLLENFQRSPHGFLVTVLAVEPLSGQSAEVKQPAKQPGQEAQPARPQPVPRGRRGAVGTGEPALETADNPVVLIQQSLKVTLLVRVVRPGKLDPAGREGPPVFRPGGPRGPGMRPGGPGMGAGEPGGGPLPPEGPGRLGRPGPRGR